MGIDRILAVTTAGPMLGGLSWRPPNGGRHSMRRLHEARSLTSDASHYVLLQSGGVSVYGLFQPKASEELVRVPRGVVSAAHCFARLVGRSAPNAALILGLPFDDQHHHDRVYVVVLEDGLPVVDSLTSETEARNALGSEDRPIWSDQTLSYPNATPITFEALAQGYSKAARVRGIPMNPIPLLIVALAVTLSGAAWFIVQQAEKAQEQRQVAAALAAADPTPKYLAALAMQTPQMSTDREQWAQVVEQLFLDSVHVPGWNVTRVKCEASTQKCATWWLRKGGSFDDLKQARPRESLAMVTPDGSTVPSFDLAVTTRPIQLDRRSLWPEAGPGLLLSAHDAWLQSAPLWQLWKTADIVVDLRPPSLWPKAQGVPPHFMHPDALVSGALSIVGVPGPFILEALRTAPTWVSWESVQADLSDGDIQARLKFIATGVYYAKHP